MNATQSLAPERIETSPAITYRPQLRIESLDSIRGLAALAVLFSHTVSVFAWPMSIKWVSLPLLNIVFDGRSAVTMFFVLSGFVLSKPFLGMPGNPGRPLFIPTFYLRRVARIWIPWFCIFCVSALARACLFQTWMTVPPTSSWLQQFWHSPLDLVTAVRQCGFALHDAHQQLMPQDWSVGVELKGSALIPLYVFILRKHILYLLALTLVLLVFLPTGEYYASFTMGIVIARFFSKAETSVRSLKAGVKWAVLIAGLAFYESRLVACAFIPGELPIVCEKLVWCLSSFGCALMLVASLGSRRVQWILNRSFFVSIGRISYSIYLVQFIVLLCVLPPVVHCLNGYGIQNGWLIFGLLMPISLVVTLGVSAVAFKLIEVPSVECGRWLTNVVQRRCERCPRIIQPLSV